MSTPSLLTFTIQSETINGNVNTVNNAIIDIGKKIEPQVITWRGYQVVMDTFAHALAQKVVYLDVPWLGGSNLQDGRRFQTNLPLLLRGDEITTFAEMNMPLQLIGSIEKVFTARLYNRDGTPVDPAQVLSVSLYFTYGSAD